MCPPARQHHHRHSEDTIERITHEYAANSPAFMCQCTSAAARGRRNGGAKAFSPALVGAWRYPGGGAVLSTSGFFKYNTAALERPDLIQGRPRTINMSQLGGCPGYGGVRA